MPLRIKSLCLLLLLFLLISLSSASDIVEGSREHQVAMHGALFESENVEVKMNHRKMMFESTLDYDDAGPNPKHDPRRKPGGKP